MSFLRDLTNTIESIGVVCFLTILATEVLGLVIIYPKIAYEISNTPISFYITAPIPYVIFRVREEITVLVFHVECFLIFLIFSYILLNSYRRILTDNRIRFLLKAFSLIVISQIAYVVLINVIGVKTYSPISEFSLSELVVLMLHASIYEEVLLRIAYLGVPIYILRKITGQNINLKDILFGGMKVDKPVVVFLILSSVAFGLAHVPGWGVYKAVPTFLAGLIFGYAYVKKGIPASIILHFGVDFSVVLLTVNTSDVFVYTILALFLVILANGVMILLNRIYYIFTKCR